MCAFHGDEEKPSCTFFAEGIKIGNTRFKSNGMVEITESHIQFRVANSPIQVKIHGDVIQAVGFNRWSGPGNILLLIYADTVDEVLDSLGVHRSHVDQSVMAYCGLTADGKVLFTVDDISRDVRNAIAKLNENIGILFDCTEAPSEQSNENGDRDSPSTSSERQRHSAIREEVLSTAMASAATFKESENDRDGAVASMESVPKLEESKNGQDEAATSMKETATIEESKNGQKEAAMSMEGTATIVGSTNGQEEAVTSVEGIATVEESTNGKEEAATSMEGTATIEGSENVQEETVHVSYASTLNEIAANGHQNIEAGQMDNRKISISAKDLDSLKPKTYLNDNIVNSYLIHVLAEKQKQNATKIRLMDNFFLTALTRSINMKQSYSIATGKFGFDIKLCSEIARKKERLIQKNKIFDADFLVLPICHEKHWFLIIVCHLSNVLHNEMNCKILIFDSIHHEEDYYQGHLSGLLHFIAGSYMLTGKRVESDVGRLMVTLLKNIEVPDVPRQTNATDCGLYLIEYVERFFDDPNVNRDWCKLIDKKVMKYKRQKVKKTLGKLME